MVDWGCELMVWKLNDWILFSMHFNFERFKLKKFNIFTKLWGLVFWIKYIQYFEHLQGLCSISSSGLKNIVLSKYQDDFTFVFGKEKFQMKNIFAEFISPVVSHLHQTDPTINTIDFGKLNGMKQDDFNKLSKSFLSPHTISQLQLISIDWNWQRQSN